MLVAWRPKGWLWRGQHERHCAVGWAARRGFCISATDRLAFDMQSAFAVCFACATHSRCGLLACMACSARAGLQRRVHLGCSTAKLNTLKTCGLFSEGAGRVSLKLILPCTNRTCRMLGVPTHWLSDAASSKACLQTQLATTSVINARILLHSKGLAIVWPRTSSHYVPNKAVLTNSNLTNMRYLVDHRATDALTR